MTLYFLINPAAKNGYSLKVWKKIERELQSGQLDYHFDFTRHKGHGAILADKWASEANGPVTIIVVGGDGSLSEVVNGVFHHPHVRVGFIPAGSGNDFARGFRIPSDPLKALEVLLRQQKREPFLSDLGRVRKGSQSFLFVNNMGAGFDGTIAKKVNLSPLKKWLNRLSLGGFVYPFFVIKEVLTYQPQNVTVRLDGTAQTFKRTWFVTVSNQTYYGGGMKIAPDAVVDDGWLDLVIVHNLSRFKLLAVFISVFWGKHTTFKEVEIVRAKQISLEANGPMDVHMDGDYMGTTPCEVNVEPRAVAFMTRESQEDGALKELKKA